MEKDYTYQRLDGKKVKVPASKAKDMHRWLTSKGMTVVESPDGGKNPPPKRVSNKVRYSLDGRTGRKKPPIGKLRP